MHAVMNYGSIPTSETKVAILGSGNVSQGAFQQYLNLIQI